MNSRNMAMLECVIGDDTQLSGGELNAALQFAALDAMRRAGAAGLGENATLVLQILLMIWLSDARAHIETTYVICTSSEHLEDLSGLDEEAVFRTLAELLPHLRVEDPEFYFSGEIEVGLEPLLLKGDGELGLRLDRYWCAAYVHRRLAAIGEAEETIEVLIAQRDNRARSDCRAQIDELVLQWTRFQETRRLTTLEGYREALVEPRHFEAEMAELAVIHDGLVGLLTPPQEYAALFADRRKVDTGTRMQAMRPRPLDLASPTLLKPRLKLIECS